MHSLSTTPEVAAVAVRAQSPELVLVVPCYNEERRLDLDAFEAMLAGTPRVLVLFVDDGSRDGTLPRVREFAAHHPGRVAVHALAQNQGKAEAVRQGMLHGLGYVPTFIGFWDADLATPLGALDRFTAVLRTRPESSWVFGSRVRLLGRQIERQAGRHYAGRVFATAASLVLRLPVYDTQCGAKLFRADDALREALREPFISRWLFDVEMIARYGRLVGPGPSLEERIYELPLDEWRDVKGSKVTAGAFVAAALELARIARKYPAPMPVRPLGAHARPAELRARRTPAPPASRTPA